MNKVDIIFFSYILLILPIISLIYFAYIFTNFEKIFSIAGLILFWIVAIPYPLYWYGKNRIFI
ncbi:MAG: hypothetical protein H5T45_05065 [Thermoplasmatales archaeon]|nr:hypothetical protein [Thermoplasmatales archaeon]